MEKRINIASGSVWEDRVGYSRAVRVGKQVEVSGTTSVEGDTLIGKNDLYEQTMFILQKIERSLHQAGASIKDVVRTRMYVTDISQWEEAGKAHAEFFRDIKPATSMVEVSKLIHPDLLIEIEATAIISNNHI
ncbi:RidA family protein [Daejeonella sp. H1SJ63]|jgi:enamine deaminase RidA (YjgF/YER057c/UK114 family)|uniref:RidA family protein n=1 Tax=Daejeonella sp. H1SJ63 TaxID=3034145 RepID=UPI0023EB99DA|nr:RidA family protein [Daejeonella sp. H1SJ63]